MRVELYKINVNNDLTDLSKHELVGTCELFLPDAIKAKDHIWKGQLINSKRTSSGIIILKIEELSGGMSSDIVKIAIEGEVKACGLCFFKLLRGDINDKDFVPVYQSEAKESIKGLVKWKTVVIGAAGLIRDSYNHPLALQFYKHKNNGQHEKLGEFNFTYGNLVENIKWKGGFGILPIIT